MSIKILGRTGDVDPFNYGGGVVFVDEGNWQYDPSPYRWGEKIWVEPNSDAVQWWFWDGLDTRMDGDDIEDELETTYLVHQVEVPEDVLAEYDYVDLKAIASYVGMEEGVLRTYSSHTDPMLRVQVLEAINSYDSTALNLSTGEREGRELNTMFLFDD